MTGADGAPAGEGGASTLEMDLKELERLLKADASNGGSDGTDSAVVVASGSSVKQQLREVLRKLMEAYFAPAAVHKRETRSLLGLLKVALQRHAEVFTGSSTFCARAFAHLLPLVTCSGLRCDLARSWHPSFPSRFPSRFPFFRFSLARRFSRRTTRPDDRRPYRIAATTSSRPSLGVCVN